MDLKGKRIAVLVEEMYQELEFWYPVLRFREAGAEVVVVGPTKAQTYKSKLGYPVTSDAAAQDVDLATFHAVVVPGGFAPDFMRRTPAMIELVKNAYARKLVVAAICHAPWMLASAGILKGKRATSFFSMKDDVVNAGAQYVNEEVVRDGNLITSRSPEDLPAFCREIQSALTAVEAQSVVAPVG